MNVSLKVICYFFVYFCLLGCVSRTTLAPVFELNSLINDVKTPILIHIVSQGDTLYAIAFKYDEDFSAIAAINNLSFPYKLYIGQKLILNSNKYYQSRIIGSRYKPQKTFSKFGQSKISLQKIKRNQNINWLWPVEGKIISNFVPTLGKKGINIAAKKGQGIVAAADGIVAYAGNGLKSYGNLIILKHNVEYLTAYGHNYRNLVKEGQHVNRGQVIAEAGLIENKFFGLHFEIRKFGKPVNPLKFLA